MTANGITNFFGAWTRFIADRNSFTFVVDSTIPANIPQHRLYETRPKKAMNIVRSVPVHFSHDPDRQNADDSIEAHCLDDIFHFPKNVPNIAISTTSANWYAREGANMDAKTQIRIRKSLARGSSQSPFFLALTAHAVIPRQTQRTFAFRSASCS